MKKIQAYKKQNIAHINAENIKHLAERRANQKATTIRAEANSYYESQKIFADTQVAIIRQNGEARLAIAKSKSGALITEAAAEGEQANKLENKRRFNEKMALASSMKDTARNNKVVVAGENG